MKFFTSKNESVWSSMLHCSQPCLSFSSNSKRNDLYSQNSGPLVDKENLSAPWCAQKVTHFLLPDLFDFFFPPTSQRSSIIWPLPTRRDEDYHVLRQRHEKLASAFFRTAAHSLSHSSVTHRKALSALFSTHDFTDAPDWLVLLQYDWINTPSIPPKEHARIWICDLWMIGQTLFC